MALKRRADGRFLKVMEYKRPNGTRYKKYFYAYEERDLYKMIAAYEIEQEQGRTFKKVAEDWKDEHYPTLEYNTQKGYDKSYKKAVDHFGEYSIKDITPTMIKAFVTSLAKKGYAAKTVTHHLSILKLILTKAVIDGEIPTSPAEYIKPPSGMKKTKRIPPTPEEVKKIKESLSAPFGLFAYFILYTGLRKSEALALQWKDIDFEKKEIHITKAWYEKYNKPCIKPKTKTDAGDRVVPLLDPLLAVLVPGDPEDYVFGLLEGKRYKTLWDAYKTVTGIKCGAHQIRHEFVTMLYDVGINEFDAMHIVGHADITTMRNIYTHIRESKRSKITDILNANLTNI